MTSTPLSYSSLNIRNRDTVPIIETIRIVVMKILEPIYFVSSTCASIFFFSVENALFSVCKPPFRRGIISSVLLLVFFVTWWFSGFSLFSAIGAFFIFTGDWALYGFGVLSVICVVFPCYVVLMYWINWWVFKDLG